MCETNVDQCERNVCEVDCAVNHKLVQCRMQKEDRAVTVQGNSNGRGEHTHKLTSRSYMASNSSKITVNITISVRSGTGDGSSITNNSGTVNGFECWQK
jgi:hypothetical protein